MLLCVCSVIDRRWRQNVVRTKKVAYEVIAECVTDVLTTYWRPLWSIHWTDAWQHGIYLFYTIKKQTTTAFLFQNLSDPCPLRRTQKKPFDVICCPYKMKQSHWLLCVAKNCDWSRKITPLSNLAQRASRGMNLQQRQNWTAKSTDLKKNTGKIKSVFVVRTALWAEKLGCCREYCRSWKNMLGKLVVVVNTGGHLIWVFLNVHVRSTDGGNFVSSVVGDSQISSK